MAIEQKLLTGEDLWNMPDNGGRRELWDGVLVELPLDGARHGAVLVRLGSLLYTHTETTRRGQVFAGGVGIILRRNPDRVLAPDICFISAERLPADETPDGFLDIVPDFVIEIISPSDRAGEVQAKVDAWLEAGVLLVWDVYPRTRTVWAFPGGSQARKYTADEVINAASVLPGFSVPVAELFA